MKLLFILISIGYFFAATCTKKTKSNSYQGLDAGPTDNAKPTYTPVLKTSQT